MKWLNQHLKKIWPCVNEATSLLLKTLLEPILESYKPTAFSSLKLKKFTLGTIAPQFTGVRLVETGKDEILMELGIQWDGNPSIILAVEPVMGLSLPVQVKDIAFAGTVRVIFKPFVNDMPGFGAIVYSLKELENFDFKLKVIGGDVTAFPGLEGVIEGTIKTAVLDSLLWPARNIFPIVSGDYSNLELRVVGILEVKVVQGKQLKNKDLIGKSDPFAQVYVRPLPNRMKKTKTINNDSDPIWNEHFKLEVEDLDSQKFTIKVFDDEGVQAAQLIGTAELELKNLKPETLEDLWLPLTKESKKYKEKTAEYRGEVHVELIYHTLDEELNQDDSASKALIPSLPLTSLEKVYTSNLNGMRQSPFKSLMKEGAIIRGILSVTVIRAENLIAVDLNNQSDPYVVIKMKKSDARKTTRVISKCLNPEWNQTFDFMVEDALHDMILLEVFDHNTFIERSLGRCALTLTRVLREGEYHTEVQLLGVKTGVLFLSMKWTQPIPPDLQYI